MHVPHFQFAITCQNRAFQFFRFEDGEISLRMEEFVLGTSSISANTAGNTSSRRRTPLEHYQFDDESECDRVSEMIIASNLYSPVGTLDHEEQ